MFRCVISINASVFGAREDLLGQSEKPVDKNSERNKKLLRVPFLRPPCFTSFSILHSQLSIL